MNGMRHGEATKRLGMTPEYRAWRGLKGRCLDSGDKEYHRYGGRGITVCQRWIESYENFLADVGRRPSEGHSLDRIDVNGNYEPGNCRWATRKEQQRNRRDNFMLTHDGRTLPVSVWAKEIGVSTSTLKYRIKVKGLSASAAITIEKHVHCRRASEQ